MKKWLNILYADLATLILGVLLAFAFAPYEIFPLAIISPAGLLVLCLKVSPRRAFWLGFIFGLGLFGAGIYWVFHSIHVFGGVPSLLAGFITSILIAAMALFPATVTYLTNRYFPINNAAKIIYAFPVIWLFSEYTRSWMFSGFPWLFLGYSQTNSPLKGYAPILSVYGVSLAVIMSSSLLVYAIIKFKQKEFRSTYLCLFAMMTIWIVGGLLSLIPWTQPTGKAISVSLVQGNIPQAVKWSPEYLQLSFDRYEQLTEPLWGKDKLIIWPEAAIPLSLRDAADFINAMDAKAKATGSRLILGIPIPTNNGDGYNNAIVTLGKDHKVYLKRRLVPFGEYIPFADIFSDWFKFMDIPMTNTIPGDVTQPPLTLGNLKILTSICYEVAFPELLKSRDPAISFLLTVTNDAWFGDSSAQAQHLQMAEMRALEFKRPVVFVSNDGITAIINPDGSIAAAAPPREPYVLNGTVQPMQGLTPWMRNGTDPIIFILLVLLIVAIRSKKNPDPTSENTNGRTLQTARN